MGSRIQVGNKHLTVRFIEAQAIRNRHNVEETRLTVSEDGFNYYIIKP